MITAAPPEPPPTEKADPASYGESDFPALRLARAARATRRLGRLLLWLIAIAVVAAVCAPWQQSIRGEGGVVALDPFERPQSVDAPVKGRIATRGEGVQEGAFVEKGQLLFKIQDQDPLKIVQLQMQVSNAEFELRTAEGRMHEADSVKRLNQQIVTINQLRLEDERSALEQLMGAYDASVAEAETKINAAEQKLAGAQAKSRQLELDYQRKTDLRDEGLASDLDQQKLESQYDSAVAAVREAEENVAGARNAVAAKQGEREAKRQEWNAKIRKTESEIEKARSEVVYADISIAKTTEEIQQKKNKLEELRSKLRQQQTQDVTAPRDGYIFDLAVFEDGSIVKVGQSLCRIVPQMTNPAVQIWVSGNDAPLIHPGDHVRLQFEGWPMVQFSGWPSVAVGTFGGEVRLVDATDNNKGKFRVVIVPDPDDNPWPEYPYLRQGVRSNGWVLLDQVPLGYEVWRRMNGFPQALQSTDEGKDPKPPKIKI